VGVAFNLECKEDYELIYDKVVICSAVRITHMRSTRFIMVPKLFSRSQVQF